MKHRFQIQVQLAAVLTALVGCVNLVSAVIPSSHSRVEVLREFLPFSVRAGGHLFSALTGFILLTLASNLLRRKRVAWLLSIGLLVISILGHLLKGLDYEESLLSGVLLGQLLLMRSVFTARSDRPSIAQGIRVLFGALLFTLAYGTLGFFLLDRAYTVQFDFPQALVQTLAMFLTEDNAGLEPKTRFGQFFADSIYLVGAATLGYALLMLLRPVLVPAATRAERQQAEKIIDQYGVSYLTRFALFDDKAYYFSPSGKSVIAYVAKGRGAIALGDPIGPECDCEEAIVGFRLFCEDNDWYPAFYQTGSNHLEVYRRLGYRILQVGEEAIVELKTFTISGKANKNLRSSFNRLSKAGYQVKIYEPPLTKEVLLDLRSVSHEWLRMMHGAEKQFSVGWFDEGYVGSCTVGTVYDPQGQIVAFANVISQYQANEVAVDLMRRRSQTESGVMEFLFISLLQYFQERGYEGFNLGLSALSGVGMHEKSPRQEKVLRSLSEHLNQFYNFKGLHTFKGKFNPSWQPRYLVYPNLPALPDVVIALVRADSGDRLLDYFKPGS